MEVCRGQALRIGTGAAGDLRVGTARTCLVDGQVCAHHWTGNAAEECTRCIRDRAGISSFVAVAQGPRLCLANEIQAAPALCTWLHRTGWEACEDDVRRPYVSAAGRADGRWRDAAGRRARPGLRAAGALVAGGAHRSKARAETMER